MIGSCFSLIPLTLPPVCTTELGYTAKLKDKLAARGAKALVISVDTVEAHKKWIEDIEDTQGADVNFPIIGDPEKESRDALQYDSPERRRESHRSGGVCHR